MKAYLATNIMGAFAFDADGKLLTKKLFPKKPAVIAEKLDAKGLIPEEEELLRELAAKGYHEIVADKHVQFTGVSIINEDNIGAKALQEGFRGLAISLKWVSSQAELNELLGKVQIMRTRDTLRRGKRDRLIVQVVGLVGELDKSLNAFSERFREWYGLHFPELSKALQSHEKFVETVAKQGRRQAIAGYESLAKNSAGMDFSDADIAEVKGFARTLLELYQQKDSIVAYLEMLCHDVMPTTAAVAGDLLAARLIAHAGSLEKLSRLPSSTVQILGAEKALFRHLKDKSSKAPKYGVLFAHPLVQHASQEKRGKVARMIAAKVSLAARTDFFSHSDKGAAMRKQLEDAVGEL